jgi:hypothetical protein
MSFERKFTLQLAQQIIVVRRTGRKRINKGTELRLVHDLIQAKTALKGVKGLKSRVYVILALIRLAPP